MGKEIFHIFQQQDRRSLSLDNRSKMKKQRALSLIAKTMLTTEAFFLRNSGDRKWLARKTRCKQVVIRDVRRTNLPNIALRRLPQPCLISPLRVPIPFRRKNALATCALQANATP